VHFVDVCYSIMLQCTVQNHKISPASMQCYWGSVWKYGQLLCTFQCWRKL